MPIVILSEHKNVYFDALENADTGDYQSFVDFMLARSLDTIKLVDESVRSALSPSAEQSVAAINDLYLTRGGYTHEEVDQAGVKLMEALANEVKKVISRNTLPKVSSAVNVMTGGPSSSIPSEYRPPISGARGIQFAFSSAVPAQGTVARIYSLLVSTQKEGDTFTARIDEVIPAISGVLQMRLSMFAEGLVGEMLQQLRILAENAIRGFKVRIPK